MPSSGSILNDTKKLLGITEEYTEFDRDIILDINTVFMIINQLGVGPKKPFVISSSAETWNDFTHAKDIEAVKSYLFLKVKMIFDPPQVGPTIEAYNKMISELEWRLNVQVDPGEVE